MGPAKRDDAGPAPPWNPDPAHSSIASGGSSMRRLTPLLLAAAFALAACVPVAAPEITYDPNELRFSGDEALAIETDFVARFPDRDSGQPNNPLAADASEYR